MFVNLGMTGSRNGITAQQLSWMHKQLSNANVLHHGACIGADEEAHHVAVELGLEVFVHPPTDTSRMMTLQPEQRVLFYPPKPYLDRNRDIVDMSARMIAFPDGPERPNGGTWYTIKYAVSQGKPVDICYPNGHIEYR